MAGDGREVPPDGARAEEVANSERVFVNDADTPRKVSGVAFHEDGIFVKVGVFVGSGHVRFERGVVTSLRIEN